ncbi:MAG TPA: MFS transporter [Acidimicrobiia bacterium]|nr:MFS transporter [Acidimicrobiia bacterium]
MTYDRVRLQRRFLGTLMVAQAFGFAALATAIAYIVLLGEDLLGSESWAGLPAAVLTLSAAAFSPVLARRSARHGRRSGLFFGFVVGTIGGVATLVSGRMVSFALLLAGMVAFGAGQAAILQTRYAAADLAEPDRRSQAIAAVVWVGTIGAVAGPFLGEAANAHLAGFGAYGGALSLGAAFFALAAVAVMWWLRPDPLQVSGGLLVQTGGSGSGLRANLSLLWCNRRARLATGAMIVSQATMVAVMVMTPLHLKDHGHAGLAGPVIAIHVLGMFGLSPLVGKWADRFGSNRVIMAGGVILASGTVMAVVAGYQPSLIFGGLLLLGLGYSFCFIAGSSLLTAAVESQVRVAAQGTGDLVVTAISALAALGSGLVKETAGYHWLANLATTFALLLVAVTVAADRQKEVIANAPT